MSQTGVKNGEARPDHPLAGDAAVEKGAVSPEAGSAPGHMSAGALVLPDGSTAQEQQASTAIRKGAVGFPPWLAATEQFESFRELRTRLLQRAGAVGQEHFTTMVVPMTAACGGSFVARNLAAAFTLQQRPSLVIECNFRAEEDDGFGPGRDAQGLFEFLSESDNPSAVVPIWPSAIRGLNVIPAGRRDAAHAVLQREQLSSPAMRELMAKVRSWPCHVFLDAPPVEGSPDARILAEFADVVVLVVGYARATAQAIAQAASMFDQRKFAGAVFNDHSTRR